MKLFKKFLLSTMAVVFMALPLTMVNAQETEDTTVTYDDYSDFDWEAYYNELYEAYDDYSYDSTTLYGEDAAEAATAALIGGTAIMGVVLALAGGMGLVMYVYTSLTMMKVAQRLDYDKPWFAWIPILNMVQLFQLGEQNPWLIALVLIPGLGALIVGVISIIAIMKICEKRGYDKLLALLLLIPIGNLILLGMLAWGKKEA